MLNDVSALRNDPDMISAALKFDAVVLMHRGGDSPKTMQERPRYLDVVAEVSQFLSGRIESFVAAGGDRKRVLVDPGIGFGKDLDHNLALLKHLGDLAVLAPVVLAVSRKSFLSRISPDKGPEERLPGSLAAACWAALHGASVVRVHDVLETRRALSTLAAIRDAK
jgi:dihydropteroate synthase